MVPSSLAAPLVALTVPDLCLILTATVLDRLEVFRFQKLLNSHGKRFVVSFSKFVVTGDANITVLIDYGNNIVIA